MSDDKVVDVEKVIFDKNPKLAKFLPGFFVGYLKRIVHQEEVNDFLSKNKLKFGLEFVDAVMAYFEPEVVVRGAEHIQKSSRIVIASNHPLGGLDGVALMHEVGKVHSEIQVPSNDILQYLKNLNPLFIPVNKHGRNTESVQNFNSAFSSKAAICYFPFGLVSRKQNGVIRDLDWKKTFLTKAKKFERDIVPTHINGRNTDFFYNLSNIRKALGIKMNIEMLYLADEFFKQKKKKMVITFGTPIPWQTFDQRNTDAVWAEKLRNFVYFLAHNPDAVFDPETNYHNLINQPK